jgi:hypothetical protein
LVNLRALLAAVSRPVHRGCSLSFIADGSLRWAAPRGPEAAPKYFRIFAESRSAGSLKFRL